MADIDAQGHKQKLTYIQKCLRHRVRVEIKRCNAVIHSLSLFFSSTTKAITYI